MQAIELLAPAKNAETAIAAIRCGADAVYIGPPRFGARQAAANSIEVIENVVDFAHPYYAKVYVTLNTILFDNELPAAENLIHRLYEIGIDGLIIQDLGLLELDLPPLPLIASTQMNNDSPEKIKFLEQVGFSRAILARELTIEQIRKIRKETSIELEIFILGSLCVGASGRCLLSYSIGGRSANRGCCAQPCRNTYMLKDNAEKILAENRYLLSLKDLNLCEHIGSLIDAGVSAFKIEGRLKDISYVANSVAFCRQKIDCIIKDKNLRRSSSGFVRLDFLPDLGKTFNRSFTAYGLADNSSCLASIDTPKSIGQFVGTVTKVEKTSFSLDYAEDIHNADGICFFDRNKNLTGTLINRVDGNTIRPQKMVRIEIGTKIYRNFDCRFTKQLAKNPADRKIRIFLTLQETADGFILLAEDEDGNKTDCEIPVEKQPASKPKAAEQTIVTQLKKLGTTIFDCSDVKIDSSQTFFLPVSVLNNARRTIVSKLLESRLSNRPRLAVKISKNDYPYPDKHLAYLDNVLNKKAADFYRRHGVSTIEPAAESGLDMAGRLVMTTKYCIRNQLGLCPAHRRPIAAQKQQQNRIPAEPLVLEDENKHIFRVEFLCSSCGMNFFLL